MIAVAVAPSAVATATTGAERLATGQLATMKTMEPRHQFETLITERKNAVIRPIGSTLAVTSLPYRAVPTRSAAARRPCPSRALGLAPMSGVFSRLVGQD